MLPEVDPAICSEKLKEWMWNSPFWAAEAKHDGSRYLAYVNGQDVPSDKLDVKLISRGQKIDRGTNVPHIAAELKEFQGCIFDGEILAQDGKFESTISVMNSSASEALKKQKQSGWLNYHVFDLLYYNGEDIRSWPLILRYKKLQDLLASKLSQYVRLVTQIRGKDKLAYYQLEVQNGREGVILKNLNTRYAIGWCKVKATNDFSTVITKIHSDRDAIELSVNNGNGKLIKVGDCAATSHQLQIQLRRNPEEYLGKVLDVKCLGLIGENSLRSPVWIRLRPDMLPETVTLDKLKSDLKLARK